MPNGDPISVIISQQAQAGLDNANASLEKTIQLLISASDTVKGLENGLRAAGSLREVVNGQREVADSVRGVSRANKEARDALKAQRAEEKEWQRMLKEEATENKRIAKERADALRGEERQRREYEKWWADAIKERQRLETEAAKERERIANLEARRAEADINTAQREAAAANRPGPATPLERATTRHNNATGNDARDIALLNEQTRAATASNRQWAQSIDYAEDSLAQMRVNVENLRREFTLLTRAERDNVDIGGRLTSEIADIDRQLDRHARSTGRASSSFNGLGVSVQRVVQELPNASQGIRLFALAISNNIAPLQEEIQRATAANAALRAEGQATVPVIRQIVKSIISWQTAVLILTTLFVTYSKEIGDFFSEMVSGKKIITDAELTIRAYNAALTESAPKTAKVNAELSVMRQRFFDATASVKDKEAVVKELNEKYGSTIGKINGINEAEAFFVNKTEAYIRAITLRAQADGAKELISKNFQTQLERENKSVEESQSGWRKFAATVQAFFTTKTNFGSMFSDIGKARDEMLKMDKDVKDMEAGSIMEAQNSVFTNMIAGWEREAAAIETKFGFNPAKEKKAPKGKGATDTTNSELKADQDLFKFRMEKLKQQTRENIETQKTIMEDETKSYRQRLQAAENYGNERINLLNMERAQEEGIIKIGLDRIESIEAKSAGTRTEQEKKMLLNKEALQAHYDLLVDKNNANKVKAERENSDAIFKVTEDEFKRRQQITQLEITDNDEKLSARLNKELEVLAESYAKGNITRGQYEMEAAMATKRIQTESLLFALDLQDEEIKQAARNGLTMIDVERKSADLRIKIQEEASKAIIDSMEQEAKAREELIESFKALGKQIVDTLFQMADASLQKEKDNLDKRKDVISQDLEIELSRIEQTTTAGVERENAIIDAKAEAAGREKQIAAEQEVIDKRRADLSKAAQAASIAAGAIQNAVTLQGKAIESAAQAAYFTGLSLAPGGQGYAPAAIAMTSAAAFIQAQVPIIAAIAAAQIAGIYAFAKGTDSSPEGLAFVGEEGHEIRINPDGETSLTPSKATLTYLQKGTQIIPNHEIEAWAANYAGLNGISGMPAGGGRISTAAMERLIADQTKSVVSAIENKEEHKFELWGMGLTHMIKRGNSITERIHRRKH